MQQTYEVHPQSWNSPTAKVYSKKSDPTVGPTNERTPRKPEYLIALASNFLGRVRW